MNCKALTIGSSICLSLTASSAFKLTAQPPLGSNGKIVTDTVRFTGQVYFGPTSIVASLAVVDDGVLIADYNVTPHLTFFDPVTGEVLSKMGVHGDGPTQFETPTCIRTIPGERNIVSVVDVWHRQLVTVALRRGQSAIVQVDTWPNVVPVCAFRFGDLVLINASFPDRVFYRANIRAGRLESAAERPPFPGEIPYNEKEVAVSPSGDRIVAAYRYLSRLEVFDTAGKRLRSFNGPVHNEPRVSEAYVAVAATSQFIYAGFYGLDPSPDPEEPGVTELQVFTWSGSLVARLPMDRRITTMTITEDNKILYGSYGKLKTQRVGRWRIPPLPVLKPGG